MILLYKTNHFSIIACDIYYLKTTRFTSTNQWILIYRSVLAKKIHNLLTKMRILVRDEKEKETISLM